MNRVNFDALLDDLIKQNKEKGEKSNLLLHSCCAPCSSYCLERLETGFDVTVFYYNPNIDTLDEYEQRKNEQIRLCREVNISIISSDYNKNEFLESVKGLENEKEGGARCEKCFYLRLFKTAMLAKEKGFKYFATTLTVSPLKNATLINEIGKDIENKVGVKYLQTDFKKKGGYLRSIELSNEYNLYRQDYCGCEYSKIQRQKKQDN